MNAQTIGRLIGELRRRCGLTQAALAERIGVSNKAVSKWESGQGYPDLSLFPILAKEFGVSIDYLMLGEERGITVAGNIILDIVKNIAVYPEIGMLANISEMTCSVGGCACNTAVDLARIDPSIPIDVIGKVGTDENGRFIVSQLQKNGVGVGKICYTPDHPTSFCDVMSIPSGERTFFHKRGANAAFCPEDIDLSHLNASIFHIGYILLLDAFDAEDKQYGTVMARFLNEVQERGIKTSIDVVSDSTGDFPKKVIPALPYCNYVIINELECCAIWGLDAYRADGTLDKENVRLAMEKTVAAGVRDLVVVHCKETSFALNAAGGFFEVPSFSVPKEDIKGSVGAGDAFCAGCLWALYNGYGEARMLEFASSAAAACLLEANAVDGVKSAAEIEQIVKKYRRREL